MMPIQRLSPVQIREQKEKGLCYNYDDKWGSGHICKTTCLFIMEGEDLDAEEIGQEGLIDKVKGKLCEGIIVDEMETEISIHALCGSPNPKTMRIMRYIGRRVVVILVDTEITHNFIDPSIIKGSHITYDTWESLKVRVANVQTVDCEVGRNQSYYTFKGITILSISLS